MDSSRFDDLTRSLIGSRRSLVGGGLGLVAGWTGFASADAKKKRKKRKKAKKPKPNAFGCLNVGQACNGDGTQCCSGICEGTKPKKGKPDRSRCVAHDAGICKVDLDFCSTGSQHFCDLANLACQCFLTTGNAAFCGDVGAVICRVCSQDIDCQDEFGAGAACVVLGGICDASCPATGGTACMPACPEA